MTLEEKAGLCSGMNYWQTKPVERLGIPSVMMADGPHGLRKQEEDPDHIAMSGSVPATCYPTASALACSWDRDLVEEVGRSLGGECRAQNIHIVLGPGANIKRSPLCGRNFEYFSEDPLLSSELASAHVRGVQSQGVGSSLKHFAANNQEFKRQLTDSQVDERTLREIYLASFEGVVRNEQPWTVMCAYNKLNGSYCSESHRLLTEILRDEWGFEGFVVSDWGAVNERVEGIRAGLELEMPSCNGDRDNLIVKAVQSGELDEKILDKVVERLLSVIEKAFRCEGEAPLFDADKNHDFARKAAAQCMVLLKNEDDLLPLEKQKSLAIIGGFADCPRYQGGGSSHVNPARLDNPVEEIRKIAETKGIAVDYSEGYPVDVLNERYSARKFESVSDVPDQNMIDEACRSAAKAEAAIIFTGLPEPYESEGFDRRHISIPAGHEKLIEAVAAVQPNTVVILSNGSPIEMPWLSRVKSVVEGYLGGQAFGGAAADILFGVVNPSGKLAETYPMRVQDNPSYLYFPGDGESVKYQEGLFVGYRHYDSIDIAPLFPFGYGLSYTRFSFDAIEADRERISDEEEVNVTVTVTNRGEREGTETVQLYVRCPDYPVQKPFQELKGFGKITLKPGESGRVVITLGKRAFAYFDEKIGDWRAPAGSYELAAGSSSRDIHGTCRITLIPSRVEKIIYTRNSSISEIYMSEVGKSYLDGMSEELQKQRGMTPDRLISFFKDMPLRSLQVLAGELINEEKLTELLNRLNG